MADNPYARFNPEELIIRDYLAIDRTVLANERTFLSYIRLALTFGLSGLSFIKLFEDFTFQIIGWLFFPLGLGVFIFGLIRFRKTQSKISQLSRFRLIDKENTRETPGSNVP